MSTTVERVLLRASGKDGRVGLKGFKAIHPAKLFIKELDKANLLPQQKADDGRPVWVKSGNIVAWGKAAGWGPALDTMGLTQHKPTHALNGTSLRVYVTSVPPKGWMLFKRARQQQIKEDKAKAKAQVSA